VALGGAGIDNGYGTEIEGTAKVDSNLTISGTLSLSGTSASPMNTTNPVGWQTILSGTSVYKVPVYQ